MRIWLIALALAATPAAAAAVPEADAAWKAGDFAKAVAAWRTPAEQGDADAQLALGRAYKLGRGVPADLQSALSWYRRAAAQGSAAAEDELGPLLFRLGDRRGAMPWIEKAAGRGEVRALYVLGTAHFNGDLAPRDWPKGYALMRRAADQGLPQAKTSLAQMERYLSPGEKARGLALVTTVAPTGSSARLAQPAKPAPSLASPPPPEPATPVAKPLVASAAVAAAPARTATKPAAPAGRWRVQLGAFGSRRAAEAAWGPLTRALPMIRPYRRQVSEAGGVARLQAAGIDSRAEANRICRVATAGRYPCFPVAP